MTPKLIFLYPAAIRGFDLADRGPAAMAKRGFDVEVYYLTRLRHPSLQPVAIPLASSNATHIQPITTFHELEDHIARNGHTACYLDFVGHVSGVSLATSRLFRLIKKYNARYVVIYIGELPCTPSQCPGAAFAYQFRRLINGLSRPRKILDLLLSPVFAGLASRNLLYPRPWRIYTSSPNGISRIFARRLRLNESAIVAVPSYDYQIYRAFVTSRSGGTTGHLPICVYIDEDLTASSDFSMLGVRPLTPHAFGLAMRALFEHIEKTIGLSVVIAAHPRSTASADTYLFAGRRVERGKTVELIASAQLVIAHYSTAIGFAVLAQTPVLLAQTSEMRCTFMHGMIQGYARALGAPVLDADDRQQVAAFDPKQVVVDRAKYASFIQQYLNPTGQCDANLWDIVARDLHNLEPT